MCGDIIPRGMRINIKANRENLLVIWLLSSGRGCVYARAVRSVQRRGNEQETKSVGGIVHGTGDAEVEIRDDGLEQAGRRLAKRDRVGAVIGAVVEKPKEFAGGVGAGHLDRRSWAGGKLAEGIVGRAAFEVFVQHAIARH